MGQVNGTFIYNGAPQNGATAKLWTAASFGSPPSQDTAEPGSGQTGSTITTGVTYGGDGAFRWTSISDGEYYVSCYYDNHRAWLYVEVESAYTPSNVLTTQGDLIVRGAANPERLAKITTGQYLKATASGYEGGELTSVNFTETMSASHTQPTTNSWVDWDLSSIVPAGTVCVIIWCINPDAGVREVGCRKNGTANDKHDDMATSSWSCMPVNVDENRVIETYGETTSVIFKVVGYWS